jgi:hypothetical protein
MGNDNTNESGGQEQTTPPPPPPDKRPREFETELERRGRDPDEWEHKDR